MKNNEVKKCKDFRVSLYTFFNAKIEKICYMYYICVVYGQCIWR